MNLIIYAGKLMLCSAILFGYYHLLLRNKNFHRYNRLYVLAAAALSVLLPLVRIPVFTGDDAGSGTWIESLQAISISSWEKAFVVTAHSDAIPSLPSWQSIAWILYAAGFIACSLPVLRSLLYVRRLSRMYQKETLDGVAFYNTPEPGTPFSFFQTVFWNEQVPLASERGQSILQHELFHVRAKHSRDVLFMQVLTNLFWFNPFFHILLKELQTVHEFLADEGASSAVNKYDYAELLVTQAIRQKQIAVSHQFYHHQIKRRITMIIKQPTRTSYLGRILALPLFLVLFFQVSCTRTNDTDTKTSRVESAPSASTAGILPAPEFLSKVENHWSGKEKSVAFWADTTLNLLTAKFENGEVIRTQLSEWKKLTPKGPGEQSGSNSPVFTKVEIEASYPGGAQAYARFLNKNFRYPEEAQAQEIQGTVMVQFQVDVNGNVSDVQAIGGPEKGGLREEAVRVIKASGKWEHAIQNGHAVSSIKKQPVIFRLDAE